MIQEINSFVDTMIQEKNKFETIQQEISLKEKEIERCMAGFNQAQERLVQQVQEGQLAKGDNLVKDILNMTTQMLMDNMSTMEASIQEGLKGMTFIENFEKRFTVSIFGKVKAGKSYLGNFMMGQGLKSHKIPSSYDTLGEIPVTVYDKGVLSQSNKLSTFASESEQEELSNFAVNMNEATSTIQYFELGGMTWFDTPGIGSITLENEALAQEYVQNSDLVVYASTSDAAGTRQDFEELKKLFDMGKPILLLLTQSDDADFDIDEDGNEITIYKAKSEKDRKDMEEYMLSTMKEEGIEDILKLADLLTVSVFLANEALVHGDESLFADSNMGLFLKKLEDITKNEAAEMKRKTPATRVNKMIDDILEKLSQTELSTKEYFSKLESNGEELKQREELLLQNLKVDVNQKVKKLLEKMKVEVDRSGQAVSGSKLNKEVSSIVQESVMTLCSEELHAHMGKVSSISFSLGEMTGLEMKKGTVEQQRRIPTREKRSPQGLREHIGAFFGKSYYSSSSYTETEYHSFDLGANIAEVQKDVMSKIEATFSTQVETMFHDIFKNYYEPMKLFEKDLCETLTTTKKELEGLKITC